MTQKDVKNEARYRLRASCPYYVKKQSILLLEFLELSLGYIFTIIFYNFCQFFRTNWPTE